MLDGKPITQVELLAFLERLEEGGPIPAEQTEEEAEASWQKYKKDNNIEQSFAMLVQKGVDKILDSGNLTAEEYLELLPTRKKSILEATKRRFLIKIFRFSVWDERKVNKIQ